MTNLQAARIVKALGLIGDIRWLVNREHVSRPDSEVAEAMRIRVRAAFSPTRKVTKKSPGLGPDAIRLGPQACEDAAATFAVLVHKHNRRGYRRVMSGRF